MDRNSIKLSIHPIKRRFLDQTKIDYFINTKNDISYPAVGNVTINESINLIIKREYHSFTNY